jgi:anaerobic sulfatase-maturating enzyme
MSAASPAMPDIIPSGAPPAFHLLAKPTGATCNLDCAYCFFLSKEMLYPGSRFRMADELLEEYIRQLLAAHHVPEVNVAWQGGEPTLMGLDFFRRSIEYVEQHRRPGVRVLYTIQTNGTLIDDEWAAFFKQHDFLVGISIDGPQAMHDAYRVDKGGQPTFAKVMAGLRCLQAHGVEYNTLTTLHHANADHPVAVYRFLRDECQSRFLQFIPIIERVPATALELVGPDDHGAEPGEASAAPWSSWRDRPLYKQEGDLVTDRSLRPAQYGGFLIGVFEEWVRRDVGSVYVQMFDVALANWAGEPPGLCIHSKTCGLALALEHNGDLYACDHFVEPQGFAKVVQSARHVRPCAACNQWGRRPHVACGLDGAAVGLRQNDFCEALCSPTSSRITFTGGATIFRPTRLWSAACSGARTATRPGWTAWRRRWTKHSTSSSSTSPFTRRATSRTCSRSRRCPRCWATLPGCCSTPTT